MSESHRKPRRKSGRSLSGAPPAGEAKTRRAKSTRSHAALPPVDEQPSSYALANIALLHYTRSSDPRLLDVAVSRLYQALEEPNDEWTRTHARFLLGQSLVGRYRQTGNLSDLEWGLRYAMEAVEATPADDRDRAKRLEFVATNLLTAVERFLLGEAPDLVKSHLGVVVSSLEECLGLTPADHPGLPWRMSSLGMAYRLRFVHFNDPGDIDKAIAMLQEAVAAGATSEPIQRASLQGNLGAAYLGRYTAMKDRASLDAAVAAFERAAADSVPGSPHHGGHLQNLARALSLAEAHGATVDAAFSRAEGTSSEQPAPGLQFLVEKGERAESQHRWDEAARAYAEAQHMRDALVRAQVTRHFQTRQLSEGIDIAVRLAYARAQANDPEGALMALENGRATLLSEALQLSAWDPDQLRAAGRPDLGEALQRATDDVRQLQAASLNPESGANLLGGERAWQVRRRLAIVLDEIRTVPGFHDVDAEPTSHDIRRLVSSHPVVYVAAASESRLTPRSMYAQSMAPSSGGVRRSGYPSQNARTTTPCLCGLEASMLTKFWETLGGKLVDRWVAVSIPALAFWLVILLAWLHSRGGIAVLQKPLAWLDQQTAPIQIGVMLAILLGVAASAAVVEELTTPVLRLLEGYWPASLHPLRTLLVRRIEKHVARLDDLFQQLARPVSESTATREEREAYVRVDRQLRHFPANGAYLPTRVGNILRAAESRPGDKYGLDAVAVWPHLWLLLPESTQRKLATARRSLNMAVAAFIWGLLLIAFTPWSWLVLPAGLAVALLAWLYRIPTHAEIFAELVEAAFDLYRMPLYSHLRWPLPANPAAERVAGRHLTTYLKRGLDDDTPVFTTPGVSTSPSGG